MKWNVYNYNINQRKMEVFDIFRHECFSTDVEAHLKELTIEKGVCFYV